MASTEQTVLTIAGAAIGFVASGFNPAGALYGAQIGYMLGMSTLSTTLPSQNGPRLGDLKTQAATYGWSIPRTWGTMGHNGALIWASEIQEHKHTVNNDQGGKGGPSVSQDQNTYTYTSSFAVLFHDGPIKAVRRVYANEHMIYDAGDTSDYGTLSNAEFADWITTKLKGLGDNGGNITIYLGTETQPADPTIQSYEGAANTPAYRGFAYLVFTDIQLEKFGNRIPQIRIEYVATVDDPGTGSSLVKTIDYSGASYGDYLYDRVPTIDRDSVLHFFACNETDAIEQMEVSYYKVIPTGTISYQKTFSVDWGPNKQMPHGVSETPMLFVSDAATYETTVWQPNGSIHTADELFWFDLPGVGFTYVNNYQQTIYYHVGDNYAGKILYWGDGNNNFRIYSYQKYIDVSILGTTSTAVNVTWQDFTAEDGTAHSGVHGVAACDSYIYVVYCDGQVNRYDYDGALVDTWVFSPAMALTSEKNGVHVDRDNDEIIHVKHGTNFYRVTSDGWELLGSSFGFTAEAEPFAVFTNMLIFPRLAGAEIRFYTLGDIARTAESLDVIIGDLLESCGLSASDYDATALASVSVDGFTLSAVSAPATSINILMQAYQFSGYEDLSKLVFNLRGAAVDRTIDPDYLGAGIDEASETIFLQERLDDQNLPLKVNVSYYDPYSEYDVTSQSSQRSALYDTEQVLTVELPMVLEADAARQIAEKIHAAIWSARTSYTKIRLPLEYLELTPTDVIEFTTDGIYNRVRVEGVNIGEFIELIGIAEQQEDYTSTISGEQKAITYRGAGNPGPTELYFLDCPALRNQDGDAGFYFAAHGYLPNWRGTVLFVESLSGGWSQVGVSVNAATVGIATDVLAAGISEIVDNASTLTVRMRSGELSSSTLSAVLADKTVNAAAFGVGGRWELLQFITATDNGDDTYTLSGFIRGQNGTEWAMGSHAIGDVFILLSAGTIARAYVDEVNTQYKFRAVSIGEIFQTGNEYPFTNTAQSALPFSPVHLTQTDNGDGTYTINWVRRPRIFGEWKDYVDVPLVEDTEQYRVRVYYGETLISSAVVTSATATVTGVVGYVVKIAQLSDYYGAGVEAQITLGGNVEYGTYDALNKSANIALSNSDLTATGTSGTWKSVRATAGVAAGKWYWEVSIDSMTTGVMIGVGKSAASVNNYCGADANGWSYGWNGQKWTSGAGATYGDTLTTGDVVGVALDLDNGKIWFSKNGVWQNSGDPEAGTGAAFTGLSGPLYPQDSPYNVTVVTANFGQSAMTYTPPAGFNPGVF